MRVSREHRRETGSSAIRAEEGFVETFEAEDRKSTKMRKKQKVSGVDIQNLLRAQKTFVQLHGCAGRQHRRIV